MMKKTFLLLLFSYCITASFSQKNSTAFEPISEQVRQLQPYGTIYYSDYIGKKVYQKLRSIMKYSIYKQYSDSSNKKIIILTPKEKAFIQSEFSKQEKQQLPDSLFENSSLIKYNKLVPFVEKLNLRLYDSIKSLTDSLQRIASVTIRNGYWAFFFTKPIYLRNNSIALYYFIYYAMSSGSAYYYFYKKEKGIWKKWIYVAGIGGDW